MSHPCMREQLKRLFKQCFVPLCQANPGESLVKVAGGEWWVQLSTAQFQLLRAGTPEAWGAILYFVGWRRGSVRHQLVCFDFSISSSRGERRSGLGGGVHLWPTWPRHGLRRRLEPRLEDDDGVCEAFRVFGVLGDV